MQAHLRTDARQRLRQEVHGAHPELERAERMFHRYVLLEADPDLVQLEALELTVINGVLKVPFAPNKLGPVWALVKLKLHTLNTVNTRV